MERCISRLATIVETENLETTYPDMKKMMEKLYGPNVV
jgi:hypothetical protein